MNDLIRILDETTALVKDTDLFAWEIPLTKTGLWASESNTPSRFNSPNIQDYDVYLRGKTKTSLIANIKYLQNRIDDISTEVCELQDGTTFKLQLLQRFEFIEKDSEGFFVFTSRLRLYL